MKAFDKTFVVADLEGTLSHGITWEAMRGYLISHGFLRQYQRFFFRQVPGLVMFRLGMTDDRAFKERWILRLLRLFAGFTAAEFGELAEWVVESELWPKRRHEVVEELRRHRENGRSVLIISGLFQPMLDLFAAKLGVEGMGTPLAFVDGRFTGEIAGPLNVGDEKVMRLRAHIGQGQVAAAYGDTYRDLPMLQLAAQPVAVYPDSVLRETAVSRGWRIVEQP